MFSEITIVWLKIVLQKTGDSESVNERWEVYRRHDNK